MNTQSTEQFVPQVSLWNLLNSKKEGKDPVKVINELVDNSIGSGASQITVYVDESENSVTVFDNGNGMTSAEFEKFHTPYSPPDEVTISKHGIGSKIFPALGGTRDVRTISSEGMYTASWTPLCSSGVLALPIFNYTPLNQCFFPLAKFLTLTDSETGTMVNVRDIDWGNPLIRNRASGFAKDVASAIAKRYHKLREDIKFEVYWRGGKGKENLQKIPFPLVSEVDGNYASVSKWVGPYRVQAWVDKHSKTTVRDQGIRVYREDIYLATVPFSKDMGGRRAHNSLNAVCVEVSFSSTTEIDKKSRFCPKIGETKDTVKLPVEVEKVCNAAMMDVAASLEAAKRSSNLSEARDMASKQNSAQTSKDTKSPPSSSIKYCPAGHKKFQGTDRGMTFEGGITHIREGSLAYEAIANADSEALREVFLGILTLARNVHLSLDSANDKSKFTRMMNELLS